MRLKIVCMLFLFTETCLSQGIKVNELMYAPANGEPEWIELYNTSSVKVNLKGWKICDKNRRWYSLTGLNFYVAPDSFLVLTKSDTILSYHRLDSAKALICTSLPKSFLVNSGDTIALHDSSDALIDSVFYDPSWGGSDGKSVERISTELSPFLSTTWGESEDSEGSTPGRRNSIAALDYDLKISQFSAFISSSDSTATFRVTVKNCGLHSTSPFDVHVFLDYNNDLVIQPNEYVAGSKDVSGLAAGDTLEIILKAYPQNFFAINAKAIIEFASDEDTSNNYMWTQLGFSYKVSSVVVNEIMYAPQKPEPEWVELYNRSSGIINLRDFTLADDSGVKAALVHQDYFLMPNDFAVVAHDSSFWGVHPDVRVKVLIAKIPSLNNSGDAVVIHDAAKNLIDSVNYSPSWGGNSGGRSLERIAADGGSNDPQNFETSSDISGSTPGKINSVTPRDFDLAVGMVNHRPSPIKSDAIVNIFASILNRGLKTSGPATVALFTDKDGDGNCETSEVVDSIQIPVLFPGDSSVANLTAGELKTGVYHFGVFINYSDDELMSNNTKVFDIVVGLLSSSVVINEIMYAPKSPEQEWIELYNTTDTVIDLSNFKIETHGGNVKIKSGSIIAPKDFAVLCRDSSVSFAHYSVSNLIIQSTPSQNNNGDWMVLYDHLGNLLDSISYVPSYGGANGKSLERIDYLAGNDSSNWRESVDSTNATPGLVNSTAVLPYDVSLMRMECPKLLSVNMGATVNLVIRNPGRNAISNMQASIKIVNGMGGKTAFSDKRALNAALSPGDSTKVDFVFVPAEPGAYEIFGEIFQSDDQRKWNDTLSSWINVSYPPQSVVINEIMYSSGKTGEYFEIYNNTSNSIDISRWSFHTSSQSKPAGLSSACKILGSNGYTTMAADSAILGFVFDTSMVEIVKSMSLRDDGGCIVLMDPSGAVVDSVYYLPSWHNSDIASTSGRSLEKINPSLPSNEKTSWSTSVSQTGGTPSKRNSLFVGTENITGSLIVGPNPFSPDGDGIDDFTFISYTFPVSSVKVKVRIFDSIGRLIATPANNSILPSTGKIVWDGRDNSGKIVKFGLYILLVEVTGPNGNSLAVYKKPLVVAKKMR